MFAPHPDDETFGCGGVIAKKTSEHQEVLVVVVTDGRNALSKLFGIKQDPTPEQLKERRKEELINAVKILGVHSQNVTFLDFEDGMLEKNQEQLERQIMKILNNYEPTEIYYTHEKKEWSMDHKVTGQITQKCVKKTGLSADSYKYLIFPSLLHITPVVDRLLNPLSRNLRSVDVSRFLKQKEAAMNEYKSQITIISKEQKRPIVSNHRRFLNNHEWFYVG